MALADEPVIRIGLREIYDSVQELSRKVDLIVDKDLPARVDGLERWKWGFPTATIVALAGVITAVVR